ncbi:hypothetical protein BB427_07615 [Pseudoalteromonas sp. BMB]|nr:hypothetical protein BB427_07615 [Pseudoalteromonas sp. BMB]
MNELAVRQHKKVACYVHGKQFKRIKKTLKKQKNYLRRVIKDILRKITEQLLKQEERVKTNYIAYMSLVLNVSPREKAPSHMSLVSKWCPLRYYLPPS